MSPLIFLVLVAHGAEPTLPVILETAPAVFPREALAAGAGATVVLRLIVDATGAVVDASVDQSAGPAFDRAAMDAALSFRFAPARTGSGDPTSATILYRTVFEPRAAPVVSAEGRLRQAGTRQALAEFQMRFTGPDGARRVATTDSEGRFSLVDLAAGEWTAVFEASGYTAETVPFTVTPGRVAALTVYGVPSRPWEAEVYETVEVVGIRTAPEVTERILTADEIRYLPGTNGDVVRVVQNLPGVARPPLGIGQLLIRGTAPEDSGYAVDGVGVPIVFHFSGLSTVLAGDLLDEVSFLPGNYGVRYGRTLGGMVDLRGTRQLPERSNGHLSVDVYQSTAFVEQRIGDDTALTFAGRRSYIDAVLNPILNSGAAAVQAPRYYDGQIRLQHRTSRGMIDALVFGSDDRFKVVGGMDADADEVQIGLSTSFLKGRLRWTTELGRGWRSEAAFLVGPDVNDFNLAPAGSATETNLDLALRQELYRLPDVGTPGWRIGVDWLTRREQFLYDVPSFGYPREEADVWWMSPSPYVESTILGGPVAFTQGIRVDPLITDLGYTAISIDPRMSAKIAVTDATTAKVSVGRYSQFPEIRQVVAEGGADSLLLPESSLQFSLGAEQRIGRRVSLDVVGYVNELTDLVVGREDRFTFFTGPPPVGPFDVDPYANDGTGRILGLETQLRVDTNRFVGWIAATVSRSVRTKRPGDETTLFAYDQPIVLNALGTYRLPKRWRIGARVRYGSGNAFTPVVNRFQRLDSGTFQPVYGDRDSARLPAFTQVDLRMDKDWAFDRWTLTAYLDLQNATAAQNVEVMAWTPDYSEQDPIAGLPPLPAFGLRGEW